MHLAIVPREAQTMALLLSPWLTPYMEVRPTTPILVVAFAPRHPEKTSCSPLGNRTQAARQELPPPLSRLLDWARSGSGVADAGLSGVHHALTRSAVGDDVAGIVERHEQQRVTCVRVRGGETLERRVRLVLSVEGRDQIAGVEDRVRHLHHGIGADRRLLAHRDYADYARRELVRDAPDRPMAAASGVCEADPVTGL